MKICRWLTQLFGKADEPTIRFTSYLGNFAAGFPVMEARKYFSEWMGKQTGPKEKRYAICPGMFDYTQAGFIVRAHVDIHIKVNRAGMAIRIGNMPLLKPEENPLLEPRDFDFSLVAGCATQVEGMPKVAKKIPLPWAVFMKKGWSAHVLPALMHSNYLDKLYVYPGIVDYDAFHTINFVFTPLKECEFTIWAGEPLLQVIPFRREPVTGECRKATEQERDRHLFGFHSRRPGFYRKNFHSKKSWRMDSAGCPFEQGTEQ